MKKYGMIILTIILLISASILSSFAEDSLYVQPFRAKIFAKPSIASEVLGTVDSGFRFVATGTEGHWVQLAFHGSLGFIPAVQVAKNAPLGKSAAQGSSETVPKPSARVRTSASSAVVAGVKGLTYEDRARVTKGERSDFTALDKVDSLKISPDELSSFQLEGGMR